MIGIVIVSHSRKLAEGVRDIAAQMAAASLKIIPAGGMENGELGTDAIMISQAMLEANSGSGVVVLADLGSAILSAQAAMELLNNDISSFIKLADAPIAEGAISAAVQASIGGTLEEVLEAAELARGMQKL